MRYCVTMILAVGVLAAADNPSTNPDELAGTWAIVCIEREGQKRDLEDPLTITFEDGKYTLEAPQGFTASRQGEYTTDASESPKKITLVPADGPRKDQPIMGIYRIDGDRMEACYDPSGAGRPLEFEARQGTGHVVVTYEKKDR